MINGEEVKPYGVKIVPVLVPQTIFSDSTVEDVAEDIAKMLCERRLSVNEVIAICDYVKYRLCNREHSVK